MKARFFVRKTIWAPTRLTLLLTTALLFLPFPVWLVGGETFLSPTERVPARVLVVEGWIGLHGVRAAGREFLEHGYDAVITVGANTNNRWGTRQWNYATLARETLIRAGLPAEKIIEAHPPGLPSHRTYLSAMAVRDCLREGGFSGAAVNVFTMGVHARRSRIVFHRALGPQHHVGVIAWSAEQSPPAPWWRSSERAQDLLKETVAYVWELLFWSGRNWTLPAASSRDSANPSSLHAFLRPSPTP